MSAGVLDAAGPLRYPVPQPAGPLSEKALKYQQALDYLYSFIAGERQMPRSAPELNLVRTAALLRALGEPQQAFPCVVVAGTKGKGSTCAMLEAIARASGMRVGLWTSPHLHSYRERIQVDRQPIERETLVRLVEAVQPLVEAVTTATAGPPVTFAIGFAMALRYFADERVDLAVLEVGLGGRYDSANVVEPVLAVISSISYDHMELLGDTLAEIAWQKAGIMRAGVPVVTVQQPPEAMRALEQYAAEVRTELYVVDGGPTNASRMPTAFGDQGPQTEAQGSTAGVGLSSLVLGPVVSALPGAFQRDNAALSVGAAQLLRRVGLPITEDGIAAGLASASWPGRLEIVGDHPPVVLDGAHNGDSARRLVQALQELFPARRLVLVFGTSRDKDLGRILAALRPAVDAVVLTHSVHPRSLMDLDQLRAQVAPLLRPDTPIVAQEDVPEALAAAHRLAGPDDLICVTGSLFIVAAAREALGLQHERD